MSHLPRARETERESLTGLTIYGLILQPGKTSGPGQSVGTLIAFETATSFHMAGFAGAFPPDSQS